MKALLLVLLVSFVSCELDINKCVYTAGSKKYDLSGLMNNQNLSSRDNLDQTFYVRMCKPTIQCQSASDPEASVCKDSGGRYSNVGKASTMSVCISFILFFNFFIFSFHFNHSFFVYIFFSPFSRNKYRINCQLQWWFWCLFIDYLFDLRF